MTDERTISLKNALRVSAALVCVLWAEHLVDLALGLGLARYGFIPRQTAGLDGIVFAPLLHGGFGHLMSNSVPLFVLCTGMLYLYPRSTRFVAPAVWLGTGIVVWLIGRTSLHIGASGLVYGLAAYIFFAGVARRDPRAIAAALLVYFLYGSLAAGIVPGRPGISWESHLAAALIGLALAIGLRRRDPTVRKRYSWEDEDEPGE